MARAQGICRHSRTIDPPPGTRPRCASVSPKTAWDDATLMSVAPLLIAFLITPLLQAQNEATISTIITSFTVSVSRANSDHMEKSISCASARVSISICLLFQGCRVFCAA